MTTLARWSDAVAARLRRTTPRERLLLAGLAGIALIYAPIAAYGWRATQEDAYVEALTERSAARLAQRAARRVQAAASDTAALEDMRSWGFEAANLAVLRVMIEQRLLTAAAEAGFENVQVTVDDEIEAEGPTRWLGAQVQANLRWTPTFAFLDGLAAWPEGFRVTDFTYSTLPDRPGQISNSGNRVRLDLAFPVRALDQETP